MNFGHGELGFGACPSAKSKPVAEYWTVFSVSTPIALDAAAMALGASCADRFQVASAARASAERHFFNMPSSTVIGDSARPAILHRKSAFISSVQTREPGRSCSSAGLSAPDHQERRVPDDLRNPRSAL